MNSAIKLEPGDTSIVMHYDVQKNSRRGASDSDYYSQQARKAGSGRQTTEHLIPMSETQGPRQEKWSVASFVKQVIHFGFQQLHKTNRSIDQISLPKVYTRT